MNGIPISLVVSSPFFTEAIGLAPFDIATQNQATSRIKVQSQ
jgi:hypothetical protein